MKALSWSALSLIIFLIASLSCQRKSQKAKPEIPPPSTPAVMDSELIKCLNQHLGIMNSETVDPSEYQKITEHVNCERRGIKALLGIGHLKNVTSISFNHNQIHRIPDEISGMVKLEKLLLIDNQINYLSSEIGKLSSLEKLYLGNNRITELPKDFGNLSNLKELYLWKNKLSKLPEFIGKLKNLEVLALNKNELTSLPSSLTSLKNLRFLSLENNDAIQNSANYKYPLAPSKEGRFSDNHSTFLVKNGEKSISVSILK